MAFEVTYIYHNRSSEGGYNTEEKLEMTKKVGKSFDDVTLEKLASVITAQLARRDIWVVDVKIVEIVKKEISFKECKDGKGFTIKNKKFSFNGTVEDLAVEEEVVPVQTTQVINTPQTVNPSQVLPRADVGINQNVTLYRVVFDAAPIDLARLRKYKITLDRTYPVHRVIPHSSGNLEYQKIAITDDEGRVAIVEDKFFSRVGTGLIADKELGFSEPSLKRREPKLSFEDSYENNMEEDASFLEEYAKIPVLRKGMS